MPCLVKSTYRYSPSSSKIACTARNSASRGDFVVTSLVRNVIAIASLLSFGVCLSVPSAATLSEVPSYVPNAINICVYHKTPICIAPLCNVLLGITLSRRSERRSIVARSSIRSRSCDVDISISLV